MSLGLPTPGVIRIPDARHQVAYAGALAAAQLRSNAQITRWAVDGTPAASSSRPPVKLTDAKTAEAATKAKTRAAKSVKLPSVMAFVPGLGQTATLVGLMIAIATIAHHLKAYVEVMPIVAALWIVFVLTKSS